MGKKKEKTKTDDKDKSIIIAKDINIPKTRKGGGKSLDRVANSMMIVTTPPSKGVRSRKRKWKMEEVSPSSQAVSEKSLKETAPMILARWKTATYKNNSRTRNLAEVLTEM